MPKGRKFKRRKHKELLKPTQEILVPANDARDIRANYEKYIREFVGSE